MNTMRPLTILLVVLLGIVAVLTKDLPGSSSVRLEPGNINSSAVGSGNFGISESVHQRPVHRVRRKGGKAPSAPKPQGGAKPPQGGSKPQGGGQQQGGPDTVTKVADGINKLSGAVGNAGDAFDKLTGQHH